MVLELLVALVVVLAFMAGAIIGWMLAQRTKDRAEASTGIFRAENEPKAPTKPEAQPESELEKSSDQGEPTPDKPSDAGTHPQNDAAAAARQPKPATELGLRLFSAHNPARTIKAWAAHAEKRLENGGEGSLLPIELYLLHSLQDAGALDETFALPGLKVVRPQTNGMFYLRLPHNLASYGDTLAMLRVEAALNAGAIAEDIFARRAPANEEEIYAAAGAFMERICSQGAGMSLPASQGNGEWAARMALSHAIECLRLPFRLTTQFRMNLAAGEAAIEFEATPICVFPRHALVKGAGLVPTTHDMRARAQADYTLRVAVLLAQCAFASSSRINRVWVAATDRTPTSHACLLSTAIARDDMVGFVIDPTHDAISLLAGAQTELNCADGSLQPCQQGFSLDEERFCPPFRYEPIGLSSRELEPAQAAALGTCHVSGLEIDEAAHREQMAEEIAKRIPQDGSCSCQEAVRAVLDASVQTEDPELQRLARHTAQRLVDGTLEPDPLAIIEALCSESDLEDAIAASQELLSSGQHELANDVIEEAIAVFEATNPSTDGPFDEWRCFSNYVDRVFYNLMLAREQVEVHLVPQAYVEALITRSISLLALDRGDEALALTRRAAAICPMSSLVRLHLIQCLDCLGHAQESRQQLVILLTQAHDPEALGFGYYRMSVVLLQEGHAEAARVAYQRALAYMPDGAREALNGLGSVLFGVRQDGRDQLTPNEMRMALSEAGVPFAPTEEVAGAFMRATHAAIDAEIFPVARDFLRMLGSISRDDVLFGVFRSLEDEPDR